MEVTPGIRAPREKPAREIYEQYLQSVSWRITRNHALRRAGYQCCRCPSKRDLHVHHKTYERLGHEWDQDLEVLCPDCHSGLHLTEMKQDEHGRLYLKLVNDELRTGAWNASISDVAEAVKTRCAKLKIRYDNHQVDRALILLCGRFKTQPTVPVRPPVHDHAPLSRAEAARIWLELVDSGLPLDVLGRSVLERQG